MARRRLIRAPKAKSDLWLISFADVMTMMLCFLILLVSLSTFDLNSTQRVVGSLGAAFGKNSDINWRQQLPGNHSISATAKPDDSVIMQRLLEEFGDEITLKKKSYVKIISISDNKLFQAGQTHLSQEGISALNRILPYLHEVQYPILVTGHASTQQDEEFRSFKADSRDEAALESTWLVSFRRAHAVYTHLKARGISPELLAIEAFGEQRPQYPNTSPEGRAKNRRVELVLDARNQKTIDLIHRAKQPESEIHNLYYKGFRFDLTLPEAKDPQEGQ